MLKMIEWIEFFFLVSFLVLVWIVWSFIVSSFFISYVFFFCVNVLVFLKVVVFLILWVIN